MKQIKRLAALCFCSVILLSGCTKFGTAESEITSYTYKDKHLTVHAKITNNHGCDYYMEQGFCFRQDTFPKLNDVFTTQVKVSDYTEVDSFSTTLILPEVDTSYYVCAYVKNSAGLSYSKVEKVSTNPADYQDNE